MHDCRKFREDWIAEPRPEEPACEDCREFCRETVSILAALDVASHPAPELSDEYWMDFNSRLHLRLVSENGSKTIRAFSARWVMPMAAAACVVVAVTWGILQLSEPTPHSADAGQNGRIAFVDDHIRGLDTRVVDYLGRSELFLRTFTKIEPSHRDDIDDARLLASRNLQRIASQKTAAGDFAPVRIVLDEYESVLREIKNMDSSEDIADIKMRIQRNGLIANLKAYQPQIVVVSHR